ncbi:MAG: hypothetical protein NVSMB25_25260 [Thermoleophilaceae bacterium]
MHVACVMVFDGSPPAYEDFVDHVGSRLALVPRYRQKLAWVPLAQGRPKWIDDEHFDLRYHVRATALPRPGNEEELKTLAGRVFSVPLNRDKPLWEMWLVEGLGDDRFAILSKTHHALVDGVSGLDLLSVVFAPDSDAQASESRSWRPAPRPSGLALVSEALLERATAPGELLRPARALLRRPRQFAQSVLELAVGVGALAWRGLSPAPRTPYNDGLVGTQRRFTWVRADLGEVKSIKNELGGTVNDVILTIVTRALRRHLQNRGEQIDDLTLKAFVPVSMRSEDQRGGGATGNQVGGMIAPLPVGCTDPRTCLATISAAMRSVKDSGQAVGAQALTELTGFAPATLLDQAARVQIGQRFINLVVTNVPGPQFPLFLADRELKDIFPLVPLGNNLNLGVAIVSYNGTINFGLVSDFDNVPDLDDLAECFGEAIAEMAAAAGIETRAAGERERPRERTGALLEAAGESPDWTSAAEPARRFVAAREQRADEHRLVETSTDPGAESSVGAQVEVERPWEGYDSMRVADVLARLDDAGPATVGVVELYERRHKARKQVLSATERALSSAGQPLRA